MAKWSFSNSSWTPTAVADTATMTANGACFLQGGSSTQRLDVFEVMLTGVAGSSTPALMEVSRDSTVGVTAITLGTNGKNAALDPATAALAAAQVAGWSATTMPQRSSTLNLLTLGFNAFGGIVRWQCPPFGELKILGNTQPLGEISLSAFTGGTPGLMQDHILYETF